MTNSQAAKILISCMLQSLFMTGITSADIRLPEGTERPTAEMLRLKQKEARFALIIGVGKYDGDNDLKNPVNDAKAIGQLLDKIGYETHVLFDADRDSIIRELHSFEERGYKNAVNVIYFAGHGFEYDGENYLIPSGATLKKAAHITDEAISLSRIREIAYSTGAASNVIILDSCRDHKFPLLDQSGLVRSPSISKGMKEMRPVSGIFVAFSTGPGATAADGTGSHSPYTEGLLVHLNKPGVFIEQMFKDLKNHVIRETGNKQIPWDLNSLTADLEIAPALSQLEDEMSTWYWAQKLRKALIVNAYLSAYPNGIYLREAKQLLEELKREGATTLIYPLPGEGTQGEKGILKSFSLNRDQITAVAYTRTPPPLTWTTRLKTIEDVSPNSNEIRAIDEEPQSQELSVGIKTSLPSSQGKISLEDERAALRLVIEKYITLTESLSVSRQIKLEAIEYTWKAGSIGQSVEISVSPQSRR